MAENENVQVVKDAYAAFQRGDMEALIALLADDIKWQTPGPQDLMPHAGERRGHEGVRQFFTQLAEAEEVTAFEPREYIGQGDRVVALGRYAARVNNTGKSLDAEWVHVFTVRDGKIRDFLEFYDTARAAESYHGTAAQAAGGAE